MIVFLLNPKPTGCCTVNVGTKLILLCMTLYSVDCVLFVKSYMAKSTIVK